MRSTWAIRMCSGTGAASRRGSRQGKLYSRHSKVIASTGTPAVQLARPIRKILDAAARRRHLVGLE